MMTMIRHTNNIHSTHPPARFTSIQERAGGNNEREGVKLKCNDDQDKFVFCEFIKIFGN